MAESTELLMVALELRLMAHQMGRGDRAAPASSPLRERLTLAADAIEGLVRDGPRPAEAPGPIPRPR